MDLFALDTARLINGGSVTAILVMIRPKRQQEFFMKGFWTFNNSGCKEADVITRFICHALHCALRNKQTSITQRNSGVQIMQRRSLLQ